MTCALLPDGDAQGSLTVLKDKVYDGLRFASNNKELAEKEMPILA